MALQGALSFCVMADDGIPPEVRRFLSRYIQSVEQLEVLLLVASKGDKGWTVGEVYNVIRSSESSVRQRLESFAADGLLTVSAGPPTTYAFAPSDGEVRTAIAKTASVYQSLRVRIVEAIFKSDLDPVQGFAEAFRFRKD
jgi:hypothetical protein